MQSLIEQKEEEIAKYYSNADLWLPECSTWRIFKFLLCNGLVINIKNQIRSKEQLRQFIVRYKPITIWYSVSRFLNPLRVRARGQEHYKIADNIFLGMDLIFDFDCEEHPDKARKDALKVVGYIRSLKDRYILEYSIFSGNKGCQVVYRDSAEYPHKLPEMREQAYMEDRHKLIEKILVEVFKVPQDLIYDGKQFNNKLIKGYTSLDCFISCDSRRVVRLPLSLAKSGNLASFINLNKPLKNQIKIIIPESPDSRLTKVGFLGNEGYVLAEGKNTEDRAGIRSPAFFKFVTNRVQGCKDNYTTMLKFQKCRYNKERLIKLGNMYNLKEWYIFDSGNYIWALNLKSVSRRRLEKIMKKSDASNVGEFLKYAHTHFRSSKLSDDEGNFIQEPKLIEIIQGDETGAHSRPHIFFMNAMGVKVNYSDLCGSEKQGCFDGVRVDG